MLAATEKLHNSPAMPRPRALESHARRYREAAQLSCDATASRRGIRKPF